MLCEKLFTKNVYGMAWLLHITHPFFRILLIYHFWTRPQEKVILATARVANRRIRFPSDVILNCRIKYLKYVMIALILHWRSILAAVNFQLGNLIRHQKKKGLSVVYAVFGRFANQISTFYVSPVLDLIPLWTYLIWRV